MITEQQNIGKRLDAFLVEKFPETSKSQWQKKIKAGEVLVNGKERAAHYFLKENNEIEIRNEKLEIKENTNLATHNRLFGEIRIIHESSNYLIINKPAGLVIHPDDKYKDNTLADFILEKYPEVKKIGESPDRPGIMHRLDKEVSGLIVIARTQNMFDCLKGQFKSRQINKEYIALVHGQVEKDEDRINSVITRSKITGIFVAMDKKNIGPKNKRAITDFKVVNRFKHFTLLKLKLLTGRTHQIRVHLKSIGHSVAGDKLYVTHDIRVKKKRADLERIFLHASLLGFKDLSGEYKEFKSKLPKELAGFLLTLK